MARLFESTQPVNISTHPILPKPWSPSAGIHESWSIRSGLMRFVICHRVYIPKVYEELSSKRVLTTEWIHGLNLWDKAGITAPQAPATGAPQGGLGLKLGHVMETTVELFSAQIFRNGFVHCDPHPGTVFVRRMPSGKPQIVLLDHGLYITLSDDLRRQYARFWKGLVVQDGESLKEVSSAWGIKDPEPLADAFPYAFKNPDEARTEETQSEREERMLAETVGYFGEDGLWPRELVFLERTLGLVQGSNRFLGSPVNRIKLIGLAATRALAAERHQTMWQSLKYRWALLILDLAFQISRARQYLGYGGGFEGDTKEEEDKAARELKDTVAVALGITVD